jgi:hypothetical protein
LAGCKTGGRTLSSGSTGTVIKGKTGEQVNREAKRPKQAQPVKSAPVKSAPIKSKPEVNAENVAPKPLPPPPIRPSPIKPVEATLRPIKPTLLPLPPAPLISPESLKLEEKVNVKPIGKRPENNEKKVENGGGTSIIKEEKVKKMNWSDLLIFYALAFVTLWVICGLWGRQLSLLFSSCINKLKDWWNKDKVVTKKPAIKKRVKRTAKKVQRKKIANKGERKSNLAAEKGKKKKS